MGLMNPKEELYMRVLPLVAAVSVLMGVLVAQSASALSVDQTTGTNRDGSPKFADPDDKIPFPHVADDGSQPQPANNFQGQPVGNSGMSFGLTAPQPNAE